VFSKKMDPTESILLILDVFMIVSLIVSAILDYKKCLIIGNKRGSSAKEIEMKAAAAAELEQKNDMNKGVAGLRSDQKLRATDNNTYIGDTPVKSPVEIESAKDDAEKAIGHEEIKIDIEGEVK
jgi:hypothetical protein